MNRLSADRRAQVVKTICEGNSIRATVRITGVSKNTVVKLLTDLGTPCIEHQDQTLRGLKCKRIEADEVWAFVYAKAANVPEDKRGQFGYGDVWTHTAICADSKLIVSWLLGPRDHATAAEFMRDVASRLAHRVQLTTDQHHAWFSAVGRAFKGQIDYAQLRKIYGKSADTGTQRRYSPPAVVGTASRIVAGNPEPGRVSTSYVERQNLTMRMHMRRMTRLTNGFSKKVENLGAALGLYFMFYNFAKPHQTLSKAAGQPTTPAMAAGVADHVWSAEEIVGLLERQENSN